MKRIRFLREPKGGDHITRVGPMGPQVVTLDLQKPGSRIFEVPDEIANLLTAPRCPKCLVWRRGDYLDLCPNCHGPQNPGLAEEV